MVTQDRKAREQAAKKLEEGEAFLAANRKNEGVRTLASGLQYKVLQEGNGSSPKATDTVSVNYRGTFVDGTEFDSSYGRGEPSSLPVKGVIRGWTEALQLMKTGSRWQLLVSADLAYGERQFGRIPPNSALVFEIELLTVKESAAPAAGEPKDTRTTSADKPPTGKGSRGQPARPGK